MSRVKLVQFTTAVPVCGFQTRANDSTSIVLWDEEGEVLRIRERSKPNREVIVPMTAVVFLELMTEADLDASKLREAEKALKAMTPKQKAEAAARAPAKDDTAVMRKVDGKVVEMSKSEADALDALADAGDDE